MMDVSSASGIHPSAVFSSGDEDEDVHSGLLQRKGLLSLFILGWLLLKIVLPGNLLSREDVQDK